MKGERQLIRTGEYLVGRACRRLPPDIRADRYREWAAELPAILHDPQVRFAPRRAVRMLAYAADTVRGAAMTASRSRRRAADRAVLGLILAFGLAEAVWDVWSALRAPGHGLNYLQLAQSLFVAAYPISVFARSAERITLLIISSGILAGLAVTSWNAAQAPADWVNYLVAALLLLPLAGLWFVRRWALARRA